MQSIRIVIAQGSCQELRRLRTQLSQQADMVVASVADSAEAAAGQVLRHRPDLLITGLTPEGLDGFALLRQLAEAQALPQVIAVSAMTREDLIRQAVELGAACYLTRPLDPDLLLARIRRLCCPDVPPPAGQQPVFSAAVAESEVSRFISRMLMQLAIPPHLAGHRFLKQALLLTVEDPTLPDRMGTELYPAVARIFDTTPSRVERAIRFAVSRTWESGGAAAYCKLLGLSSPHPLRPSNRELIASLSERARLRT